jgi:DNA polymerase III sliding clamp (beta) subunit (PCNA family)
MPAGEHVSAAFERDTAVRVMRNISKFETGKFKVAFLDCDSGKGRAVLTFDNPKIGNVRHELACYVPEGGSPGGFRVGFDPHSMLNAVSNLRPKEDLRIDFFDMQTPLLIREAGEGDGWTVMSTVAERERGD